MITQRGSLILYDHGLSPINKLDFRVREMDFKAHGLGGK
jgi:hypothetical protein